MKSTTQATSEEYANHASMPISVVQVDDPSYAYSVEQHDTVAV